MNRILTNFEIQEIEKEARIDPMFRYGTSVRVIMSSKHSFTQIICVSNNGLILIKGNLETGHEHIRARHNYWSIHRYSNKDNSAFQAQSKFPENIPPMKYSEIADKIYSPENFISENIHDDADKFEKYQGNYSFDGETEEKTNLILYKGSKIIHSLYPQAGKKYNTDKNKTKYPFAKGKVVVEYDNYKIEGTVEVPYYNLKGELCYMILIEKFFRQDLEKMKILVFDENERYKFHVEIGERKLFEFRGETSERITYQHADLKDFETSILKIEAQQKG